MGTSSSQNGLSDIRSNVPPASRRVPSAPPSSNGLTDIHDWPERALAAGYRVDTLVERCGGDLHALRAHFEREFGKPIKAQLREFRLREIQRLIQKEPLKNIATALGYGNPSNLIRAFKALCGMTPCQWQKREAEKKIMQRPPTQSRFASRKGRHRCIRKLSVKSVP